MTLAAHALSHSRGERALFQDLDFALRPGEALWVRGANGSGKTSLLRLLCGLAWPDAGEVTWRGRPLAQDRAALHANLLYCGHGAGVKDDLDAVENLMVSAALAGQPCDRSQALSALAALGLADQAQLPLRALSQGQRKRVALARLMLPQAPLLWVLDEPFSALDDASINRLQARLNQHLADDGLVVYTTHQPLALQGFQTRTQTRTLTLDDEASSWRLH